MIFDYQFRNYNFRALIYMILLSVLGILVVGSASNQDRSSVIKQIIGVVVSLIICLVLSLIDYHQYFRFTTLIYVVCAGMLAAVLLFGRTTKGATRWLRIGGIGFRLRKFQRRGAGRGRDRRCGRRRDGRRHRRLRRHRRNDRGFRSWLRSRFNGRLNRRLSCDFRRRLRFGRNLRT